MKKNWFDVKNLEKTERIFKSADVNKVDTRNDFGSYKKVNENKSFKNTMIEFHNDLNPENKILYIIDLLKIDPKKEHKILDSGCGIGVTTGKLKEIFKNSDVCGIEISSDAIKYAKENFQNCTFIEKGINPEEGKIGLFDIIFAFEFYPFTRTNDWNIHKSYIDYFLKNLNDNGMLIINQLWTNEKSLSFNYKKIQKHFNVALHNSMSKKLYKLNKIVPLIMLKFVDRIIKTIRNSESKILAIKK